MEEMTKRVLDDIPISPSSWVESALRINALRGEMDNELIAYELLVGDKIAVVVKCADTTDVTINNLDFNIL
jgi:hypothetical protein